MAIFRTPPKLTENERKYRVSEPFASCGVMQNGRSHPAFDRQRVLIAGRPHTAQDEVSEIASHRHLKHFQRSMNDEQLRKKKGQHDGKSKANT
jgi:hypothetical protein